MFYYIESTGDQSKYVPLDRIVFTQFLGHIVRGFFSKVFLAGLQKPVPETLTYISGATYSNQVGGQFYVSGVICPSEFEKVVIQITNLFWETNSL